MAPDRKPKAKGKVSCPRCGSSKTNYCGFNSRNAKNPKYFCTSCSRYWIHGGCRLVSKTWKRTSSTTPTKTPEATTTTTTNNKNNNNKYAAAAEEDDHEVGRPQTEEEDGGRKVARFLEWAGALLDPQLRLDFDDGGEGGVEDEDEDEDGEGGLCVPEEFREPFLEKGCSANVEK